MLCFSKNKYLAISTRRAVTAVGTPCGRSWLAFMCYKYTVNVTKGTNDAFLNAMAWSLGVTLGSLCCFC